MQSEGLSTTITPDALDDGARQALRRIQAEYRAMPGLALTKPQIRRLLAIDAAACDVVLDHLTAGGFLTRTGGGRYVRTDGGR